MDHGNGHALRIVRGAETQWSELTFWDFKINMTSMVNPLLDSDDEAEELWQELQDPGPDPLVFAQQRAYFSELERFLTIRRQKGLLVLLRYRLPVYYDNHDIAFQQISPMTIATNEPV